MPEHCKNSQTAIIINSCNVPQKLNIFGNIHLFMDHCGQVSFDGKTNYLSHPLNINKTIDGNQSLVLEFTLHITHYFDCRTFTLNVCENHHNAPHLYLPELNNDFTLTGHAICGADNSIIFTLEYKLKNTNTQEHIGCIDQIQLEGPLGILDLECKCPESDECCEKVPIVFKLTDCHVK